MESGTGGLGGRVWLWLRVFVRERTSRAEV